MKSFAIHALAAAMMGLGTVAPALGGDKTPRFLIGTTYIDGLGRRKKIPEHPKHNSRVSLSDRQEFAMKVMETHSHNPDPRDEKYLNSFARRMRGVHQDQAAQELFA